MPHLTIKKIKKMFAIEIVCYWNWSQMIAWGKRPTKSLLYNFIILHI